MKVYLIGEYEKGIFILGYNRGFKNYEDCVRFYEEKELPSNYKIKEVELLENIEE